MSAKDATQLRLELARGHWQLGERLEAVVCLERAFDGGASAEALLSLVDAGLDEIEGAGEDELAARLGRLRARLAPIEEPDEPTLVPAPLATSTLAKLLADQGHAEKALAVADQVLRRNANDERALAVRAQLARPKPSGSAGGGNDSRVRELSRWLANLARRRRERKGGAFA
jgi:tetratricopeptide (TPR) repeat protein